MDALILAAGMGSRLRRSAPCKPLARIGGLSLLEISVRQLVSSGVTRIHIATGYRADEVAEHVREIERGVGIPLVTRRVRDFSLPNGLSVLDGAEGLGGEFLLVMADHILSGGIFEPLLRSEPKTGGAVLAVDRRTQSPLIDPDDATWVELDEQGGIRKIGKQIAQRDVVDCGAFRVTQGLLDAIRSAVGAGASGSLSEGMQHLADRGLADTVDIGEAWWLDVDDAHALALAREQAPAVLPSLFAKAEAG